MSDFDTTKRIDTGIPLYQVSKLMDELGKRGHHATSKPTYLKYEGMGIFIPGKYSLVRDNRIERLFTVEEIALNIERFREYIDSLGGSVFKIAQLQRKKK